MKYAAFVGRWLLYVLGATAIATAFGSWGDNWNLPQGGPYLATVTPVVTLRTLLHDVEFDAEQETHITGITDDSVSFSFSRLWLEVYDDGPDGTGLVCSGVRFDALPVVVAGAQVFPQPIMEVDGLRDSIIYSGLEEAYEKDQTDFQSWHKTADAEAYGGGVLGNGQTCAGGLNLCCWTAFLTSTPGFRTLSPPGYDDVWVQIYWDCPSWPCEAHQVP